MLRRIALAATLVLIALAARAGGPAYVLTANGRAVPATWRDGVIRYYTDLGDLSPVVPQSEADALVSNAFARWTAVSTAAIVVHHAGHFAEDVDGASVSRTGGTLALPASIRLEDGVSIISDSDGAVTDVLLGAGASLNCTSNAVFGGPDAFTSDGHIAHALVVINGACVQTAADLALLRSNLVRVLGRVLGLDWSQLNENVSTGTPQPTIEDYAGWPLMHSTRASGGASACVPDPEQPRMDDRAALSRLYPVTSANLAQFAGKVVFADTTARVSGSVRLANGRSASGLNVVARLVDPITGAPSRRYAASSVSGFLARAKRGLRSRGFETQGWYDLAGLEIPAGSNSARYQISVERNGAIIPGAQKMTLTLGRGADVMLDITISDAGADKLELVSGTNPGVPVGTPAPNPIKVRAVHVDDKSNSVPVGGASITFTASPPGALSFSPCNAESCMIVSDSEGLATTTVTVKQEGVITVTAALRNGANVSTTVLGIAPPVAIAAVAPKYWVAARASVAVPLTARVLEKSAAASGKTVNYKIMAGTGVLSSATAITNAQGEATAMLSLADINADVQVSACVAPDNTPCATFTVFAVATGDMRIEKAGGDQQVLTVGQNVQPVSVRVTDASTPPNPVLASTVRFTVEAFHLQSEGQPTAVGEVVITHPSQPVPALPTSETVVATDATGTATIAPAFASELGALSVTVRAEAGTAQATFAITVAWPALSTTTRPAYATRRARVARAMIRPAMRLRRR